MTNPLKQTVETLAQDGHADLAEKLVDYVANIAPEKPVDPLDEVRAMTPEQINANWDRVSKIMSENE